MAKISTPVTYKVNANLGLPNTGETIDDRFSFSTAVERDAYEVNFLYRGLLTYTAAEPYHATGVTSNSGFYTRYYNGSTYSWQGLDADTIDDKHADGTMDSSSTSTAENPTTSSNIVEHVNYLYGLTAALQSGKTWKNPVVNVTTTVPGSPATDARYAINGTGTGDWTGHDGDIATWGGAVWTFDEPINGWAVFNETDEKIYIYTSDAPYWSIMSGELPLLSDVQDGIVSMGWYDTLEELVTDPDTFVTSRETPAYSVIQAKTTGQILKGTATAPTAESTFTLQEGANVILTVDAVNNTIIVASTAGGLTVLGDNILDFNTSSSLYQPYSNSANDLNSGLYYTTPTGTADAPTTNTKPPLAWNGSFLAYSLGATNDIRIGDTLDGSGLLIPYTLLQPTVSQASGLIPYIFDTLDTHTTNTLAVFRNATTDVLTVTADGNVYIPENSNLYVGGVPISGSGSYTNSEETLNALGGIGKGSTFNNKTMTEMWNMLLYPYQTPAFTSFYIDGQATTVEMGTTLTGAQTFNWATSNSSNINSDSLRITDVSGGNVILIDNTANDGTEDLNVGSVVRTSEGTPTYTWSIRGTDSNNDFFTYSHTITWSYLQFYGSATAIPINSAEIRALSSRFKSSGNTFSLNTGTTYSDFMVCLPDGQTITSAIDTTVLGAAVTYAYVSTITVSIASGYTKSYNVYSLHIAGTYSTNHVHQITVS